MEPVKIYEQPQDVAVRLAQLGLSRELLAEALLEGDAAAASVTVMHPGNYGGVRRWAETTSGVRQRLVALGWRLGETLNYSTVYHREREISIVVMTGDSSTGLPGLPHPRTKQPKGRATRERLELNGQLALFGAVEAGAPSGAENCQTWVLLMRGTPEGVRAELSLPAAMDDAGYVDHWLERILLPLVTPPGIVVAAGSPSSNSGDDGFEVAVHPLDEDR